MARSTSRPSAVLAAPTAPRFAAAWAALVYALGTLALGFPALAGRFLVNPRSDQYIAGYAFREFAASQLRATGHFPLWNPYIFSGMPFVASMNGDLFYPTALLRLVLPTDVAMTWSFLIHVFLAGFFAYLFLRAWGFGFLPSLIGGLAYLMGGPIASYVMPGHDGKLYVSALTPLALWMLVRGIRDGRPWAFGVLAFTIGIATLSPHPQLLQYMLLVSGAFAIWLAFGGGEGGRPPRDVALRRLGAALVAVVVGMVMGAVQYLPVFQYVAWSPRAGGLKGWEFATSYSFPPEELINTMVPQFTGILDHYWGRNGIHFHSEYLGVVVLALAVLGFSCVRRGKRTGFARFWLGVLVVALLWSLGSYTPFFSLVYAVVPGTKFFRAPSTMFYVVGLAIAVFAALGLERVLARDVTRRYAVGWLIAGGVILLLGVTGALTSMAEAIARPELADFVQDNAGDLLVGAIRSAAFVLAGAVVLLLLALDRLAPRAAAAALIALAAADLWSIERMYWLFSAPASKLYASDATIDFLNHQSEPGRVLPVPLAPLQGVHDPFYLGDALMTHRVRQVLGYHGNELGRYDELLGKAGGQYRQIANPQVWRLLNVRYLLTNSGDLKLPGTTKVAGPAMNAAGDSAYVYRLPGDNPAAWVAPVIVKAPDDAVLATVLDPRFDAGRAALFDTSAAVKGEQISALPEPSATTVHVGRYDPGHIELELSQPAARGSALVMSENYYPGWRATVDGKPATVGRTDLVLIGVPLPEGARRVSLDFSSAPYERGKLVSILALLASLAMIGGGIAMDRKRHG
ncbi:MAG TPA: hypothetical protein VFS44_15740 [Gemmatimonadaceae bacterium]|nr:hypothetical protein [Gemmatimonadaceae bacterium]